MLLVASGVLTVVSVVLWIAVWAHVMPQDGKNTETIMFTANCSDLANNAGKL